MSKAISTAQVLALLRKKVSPRLRQGKLARVIGELEKDGRLGEGSSLAGGVTPAGYDVIEGEIRRMHAGWYQRRNVRGDLDAQVVLEGGERYAIRLPYERAWDTQRGEEVEGVPNVVGCWEWPTARLTGVLVRQDEQDGMPVYAWRTAVGVEGHERELLTDQWMTGSKSRAQ